ncbi:MAG TPA: ABC transporter substrate-binding protein [Candidatus Atribacteria bacterium]|nr:ABC transporter substrate-binding protein [Candidatus Atribacteria bacterium]
MKKPLVELMILSLVFGFALTSFAQEMPSPSQYNFPAEYQNATGKEITEFNEAPMLTELVEAGKLPPVEERLPEEPLVIVPVEEVGEYGGTWRRVWLGKADGPGPDRITTERLIYFTPDGRELVPNIAQSWEVSAEGKEFTFYLREGMKWSDGEPFTADDIMFWYEDMVLNDELTPVKPAWLTIGGNLGRVEKVSTYAVKFVFDQPYGLFLKYLAGPPGHGICYYPKHYLKQFHPNYTPEEELTALTKEAGFEFWYQLFGDKTDRWMNTDLPVLSAWKCTVPATRPIMVLERNPYYWKIDIEGNQLPYVDRINHEFVENIELVNIRAVSGQIDMQARHILWENYTLFMENRDEGNYRVAKYKDDFETNMAIALNLNHKDPVLRQIFDDDRFRKALSLAINRNEINQLCYLGICEEPRQVVPLPESEYFCEELAYAYIDYNPGEANRLLDEMGLKRGPDGIRLRPDGKPLMITIEFTPAFGPWADACELVAQYWTAVGVKTAVKSEERSLFYTRKAALEHDVGIWTGSVGMQPLIDPRWYMPWSEESIHAIGYAQWYQSGGKVGEKPTGDLLKTIELYEEIKKTPSDAKQKELFQEILKLNAKNLWVIGTLSSPPLLGIISNNMKNVPETGLFSWVLHSPKNFNPEQFFFKK